MKPDYALGIRRGNLQLGLKRPFWIGPWTRRHVIPTRGGCCLIKIFLILSTSELTTCEFDRSGWRRAYYVCVFGYVPSWNGCYEAIQIVKTMISECSMRLEMPSENSGLIGYELCLRTLSFFASCDVLTGVLGLDSVNKYLINMRIPEVYGRVQPILIEAHSVE